MLVRRPYLLMLVLLFTFFDLASAQVARLVHYEGQLVDSTGTAFSGQTDLEFTLYSRPRAESGVWSEVHHNVDVIDGNFSVMLGSVNPLKLSFYEYFLDVRAEGITASTERKMIVGSGYNYRLWFLFSAYTVVWLALFAYMMVLSRKQKRIIADLAALSLTQHEEGSV